MRDFLKKFFLIGILELTRRKETKVFPRGTVLSYIGGASVNLQVQPNSMIFVQFFIIIFKNY